MNDYKALLERETGWFTHSGPEYDIVVSSRIGLSRNIADAPFPGTMSENQQAELEKRLVPAIEAVCPGDSWRVVDINRLAQCTRGKLRERYLLSDIQTSARPSLFAIREDEQVTVCTNVKDHVQIAGLRGGLSLREALEDTKHLEGALSNVLRFAVNMEFGYLTRELDNCGTGLHASVLVHLPGLAWLDAVGDVISELFGERLVLKKFLSNGRMSLGNMYQLSNRHSVGASEEEFLGELEAALQELLLLERAARSELVEGKSGEMRSNVRESLQLLSAAEALSAEEAIGHLLRLRLGVSAGIIDSVSLETLTSLLFLVQKYHILEIATGVNEGDDVSGERSDLVRQILGRKLTQRG